MKRLRNIYIIRWGLRKGVMFELLYIIYCPVEATLEQYGIDCDEAIDKLIYQINQQ